MVAMFLTRWSQWVMKCMNRAALRGRRKGLSAARGRWRPRLEELEARLVPATTLSISNASLTEGNAGSANMVFTVTRSGDLTNAITAGYTTADGTATAGSDYTAQTGTVTVAAGAATATIAIPVTGDTLHEADETFSVRLTGIIATFGPAPGFAAPQAFSTTGQPRVVAVADFNGDGKPDLAVAGYDSQAVSVLLNTTVPGATTPTFGTRRDFAAGYATAIVAGDFNADGRPDLAVTDASADVIWILMNNTTAGATSPDFLPRQALATDANPTSVALADFNGDSKLDVVCANRNAGTVSVFLNRMAPGVVNIDFAPVRSFDTGYAVAVAAGDINGDGRPDLAVANYSASGTVSVLLNTTTLGNMTPDFAAPLDFATGSLPTAVAIGDVNGDGRPDLAVANSADNSVSVLLNTALPGATPSFAAAQDFATGTGPSSVSFQDLNGDGKLDLGVTNSGSGTVSVLMNTTIPGAGAPSFASKQDYVAGTSLTNAVFGDFNLDGQSDLATADAIAGSVAVLLNTTAVGTALPDFQKTDFVTGLSSFAAIQGDFNGDGRPDLAVSNRFANTVSVLLNTTAAGATTPSFAAAQNFATGLDPLSMAVGDFNGDGRPDLVIGNASSNTLSVLLNTTAAGAATPSFAAAQNFATALEPESVAVGDLNADGRPDIAVANAGSANVGVLLNTTAAGDATASFGARRDFATGVRPLAVAMGDFNGDGQLDLATLNNDSSSVSVLLNSTPSGATTPHFEPQQQFPVAGTNPASLAVADLNGDGAPDIAVSNGSTASVSVLVNTTGTGGITPSFAAHQDFATLDRPFFIGVGDFNGDGRPDLAVADSFTGAGSVSILLNTSVAGVASPSFVDHQDVATGSSPHGVALGDFNGDGRPDLAVANYYSGTTSVLLNTPATIANDLAIGTIINDDPVPSVQFTTASQSASEGASTMTITAQLSAASSQDVTVPFTVSGTADNPADYTIAASPLIIPAGSTSGSITVNVVDNSVSEPRETVVVTLGTPINATLGAITTDTITILNGHPVVLSLSDATMAGAPGSATAGNAFDVTVTALDPYNNPATTYLGTVHFTSSDPQAVLPPDFTFTARDNGVHTFSATLITLGSQSLTVSDTQSGTSVSPATTTMTVFSRPLPALRALSLSSGGVTYDLTSAGTLWQLTSGRTAIDWGVDAVGLYGNNLLDLEAQGHLWLYNGSSWKLLDVNAVDFGADSSGTNVFILENDGSVRQYQSSKGTLSISPLASNVQAMAVTGSGTLYSLDLSGNLSQDVAGTISIVDTGVQSFRLDGSGKLYELLGNGNLYQTNSQTTPLATNVASFWVTSGGVVDVLHFDGTLQQAGSAVAGNVASFQVALDGTLYYLMNDGQLLKQGSATPLDTGVRSFSLSSDGSLYELKSDGTLWQRQGQAVSRLDGHVQSMGVSGNGALYDLESRGALWQYTAAGWSNLDNGVQAIALPQGGAVLDLEHGGALWKYTRGGWAKLDGGVTALSLASDGFTVVVTDGNGARSLTSVVASQTDSTGTVRYLVLNAGGLWQYAGGLWKHLDGAAKSFALASDGTLYELETSGQLWRYRNGGWALLDSGVQAMGITSDDTLIDLEANGQLWTYNSVRWSLLDTGVSSFTIAGSTVTATDHSGTKTFSV
jgi:hypothetical protein